MIYVDTSVALAQLLAEDRRPQPALWVEPLVSSRLLEYELWVRLHGAGLAVSHGEAAGALLARLGFLELTPPVLARALEPFPVAVRTLDALHLSAADFLRSQRQEVRFATYDQRQLEAARALELEIVPLE